MKTKVQPVGELKELFLEALINQTDLVTKISSDSVLGGIGFGIASIAGKVLTEVGIVETKIFPDYAYGEELDEIASNNGISPRFGSSKSSTYVRVIADEGTVYLASTHKVIGNQGIIFDIVEDFTVGEKGWGYVKVVSQIEGEQTNVPPLSINRLYPTLTGHVAVINEYAATGGRDIESDDAFKKRIKEGPNILAQGTLSMLEQKFININPIISKIFYSGVNSIGETIISILTENGSDLTPSELSELLSESSKFLSITDYYNIEGVVSYGIELRNIIYHPIDIVLKAKFAENASTDELRVRIQSLLSTYFNYNTYNNIGIVSWEDLYQIVKSQQEIEYISTKNFNPNKDIIIPKNSYPRIRGFLMLDLEGNVILDESGVLTPVYYGSTPNANFLSYVTE